MHSVNYCRNAVYIGTVYLSWDAKPVAFSFLTGWTYYNNYSDVKYILIKSF